MTGDGPGPGYRPPDSAGRIRAVLDVTDHEVLPADHPLWDCQHALLTPRLAAGGARTRIAFDPLTVSHDGNR